MVSKVHLRQEKRPIIVAREERRRQLSMPPAHFMILIVHVLLQLFFVEYFPRRLGVIEERQLTQLIAKQVFKVK